MSDSSNPYDPQRPTFPWNEKPADDDVWGDPEPTVPLMPPPAVPHPPERRAEPRARPDRGPYGEGRGGSAQGAPRSDPYQGPYGAPSGFGGPQQPGPAGGASPNGQHAPGSPYAYGTGGPGHGYGPPGPVFRGPGYRGQAPAPFGYPPAQAPQGSKGLAITALVLAIVGAVTSLALIGIPLAIVALVLGIVALARRLNGKGMSVAAVIVSSVSLLWGAFLMVMFFFVGSLAGGLGYVDALSSSSYYDTYADDDEVARMQADVGLAEYAVTTRAGIPQYLVLVDNASADTMYPDITLTVNAVDADGEIIDTRTEFSDIYPGVNAFTGDFVVDSERVANITVDVDGMIMQKPVAMPDGNPVTAADVEVTVDRDEASATGMVENSSDELKSFVDVVVVERDAAGEITSYGTTNIPSIGGQSAEPFTATFPSSEEAEQPLAYEASALASY